MTSQDHKIAQLERQVIELQRLVKSLYPPRKRGEDNDAIIDVQFDTASLYLQVKYASAPGTWVNKVLFKTC